MSFYNYLRSRIVEWNWGMNLFEHLLLIMLLPCKYALYSALHGLCHFDIFQWDQENPMHWPTILVSKLWSCFCPSYQLDAFILSPSCPPSLHIGHQPTIEIRFSMQRNSVLIFSTCIEWDPFLSLHHNDQFTLVDIHRLEINSHSNYWQH